MSEYSSNFIYQFHKSLSKDLEQELITSYQIDEVDIDSIFEANHLSKVEVRDTYIYLNLEFPEFDKSKHEVNNKAIHCLIGEEFFILIDPYFHKHSHQFDNLRKKLFSDSENPADLLFNMLHFIISKDIRAITNFRKEVSSLEKRIFAFNDRRDLIEDILLLKRNLITFYSIMSEMDLAVSELKSIIKNNIFFLKTSTNSLRHINTIKAIIAKIKVSTRTLNEHSLLLSEANDSQIARSTNEVIKTLTSFNLLISVPTLIFSLFGMNINFGWNLEYLSLYPIVFIIFITTTSTWYLYKFLKKRKWV